jgi:hypothetical protein
MTEPDSVASSQPQLELTVDMLRSGRGVRLKALGSSMLPALWPDDELTIEPVAAAACHPGEVVLCMGDGRFVIHRLIKADEAAYFTRGDAMGNCDPTFAPHEILGRVVEIARGRHTLTPKPQNLTHRLAGWIICHFALCRRLALRLHSIRQEFWIESHELHEPEQLARVRSVW